MLADLQHRLGLDDVLGRGDQARDGLGSLTKQDVVEVVALLGRQGDGDVAALCAQTPGGRVRSAHACAGDIMIGEDHDAPDCGR